MTTLMLILSFMASLYSTFAKAYATCTSAPSELQVSTLALLSSLLGCFVINWFDFESEGNRERYGYIERGYEHQTIRV